MDELQKWWEIPCIGQFVSLFRYAFNLPEMDIEDLEEGLIADGTPGGSSFLRELLVSLLRGCYPRRGVNIENWETFLQKLLQKKWVKEEQLSNPLSDCTFERLALRTKVEVLYTICLYRIDCDDVLEAMKKMDAETLRVQSLGRDDEGNVYWYFYGTRLYKEEPTFEQKRDWQEEWMQEKQNSEVKKRGRGRPRKLTKNKPMKSDGESEESEENDNQKNRYMNVNSKSRWSVVCTTISDWEQFAENFKDSKSKSEMSLYKIIKNNFLPVLGDIYAEKEKRLRRKMMEFIPRRSSTRLETKKQQRVESFDDDDTELLKDDIYRTPEVSKEALSAERKQRLEARRRNVEARFMSPQTLQAAKKRLSADSTNSIEKSEEEDSCNDFRMSGSNNLLSAKLRQALTAVKLHKDAWPFLHAVDDSEAPEYYEIVKNPMDLSAIERKIACGVYRSVTEMDRDFQKMVSNCELYNGANSDYSVMAHNLWKTFRKNISKFIVHNTVTHDVSQKIARVEVVENTPKSVPTYRTVSQKNVRSRHEKCGRHEMKKKKKKKYPAAMEALEILAQASEMAVKKAQKDGNFTPISNEPVSKRLAFPGLKIAAIQSHPPAYIAKYTSNSNLPQEPKDADKNKDSVCPELFKETSVSKEDVTMKTYSNATVKENENKLSSSSVASTLVQIIKNGKLKLGQTADSGRISFVKPGSGSHQIHTTYITDSSFLKKISLPATSTLAINKNRTEFNRKENTSPVQETNSKVADSPPPSITAENSISNVSQNEAVSEINCTNNTQTSKPSDFHVDCTMPDLSVSDASNSDTLSKISNILCTIIKDSNDFQISVDKLPERNPSQSPVSSPTQNDTEMFTDDSISDFSNLNASRYLTTIDSQVMGISSASSSFENNNTIQSSSPHSAHSNKSPSYPICSFDKVYDDSIYKFGSEAFSSCDDMLSSNQSQLDTVPTSVRQRHSPLAVSSTSESDSLVQDSLTKSNVDIQQSLLQRDPRPKLAEKFSPVHSDSSARSLTSPTFIQSTGNSAPVSGSNISLEPHSPQSFSQSLGVSAMHPESSAAKQPHSVSPVSSPVDQNSLQLPLPKKQLGNSSPNQIPLQMPYFNIQGNTTSSFSSLSNQLQLPVHNKSFENLPSSSVFNQVTLSDKQYSDTNLKSSDFTPVLPYVLTQGQFTSSNVPVTASTVGHSAAVFSTASSFQNLFQPSVVSTTATYPSTVSQSLSSTFPYTSGNSPGGVIKLPSSSKNSKNYSSESQVQSKSGSKNSRKKRSPLPVTMPNHLFTFAPSTTTTQQMPASYSSDQNSSSFAHSENPYSQNSSVSNYINISNSAHVIPTQGSSQVPNYDYTYVPDYSSKEIRFPVTTSASFDKGAQVQSQFDHLLPSSGFAAVTDSLRFCLPGTSTYSTYSTEKSKTQLNNATTYSHTIPTVITTQHSGSNGVLMNPNMTLIYSGINSTLPYSEQTTVPAPDNTVPKNVNTQNKNEGQYTVVNSLKNSITSHTLTPSNMYSVPSLLPVVRPSNLLSQSAMNSNFSSQENAQTIPKTSADLPTYNLSFIPKTDDGSSYTVQGVRILPAQVLPSVTNHQLLHPTYINIPPYMMVPQTVLHHNMVSPNLVSNQTVGLRPVENSRLSAPTNKAA